MSNFVRHRGFLDPNRLLHAPTGNYSGFPKGPEASHISVTPLGAAQHEQSSVT